MNEFLQTLAILVIVTLIMVGIVTSVSMPVYSDEHQEGSI